MKKTSLFIVLSMFLLALPFGVLAFGTKAGDMVKLNSNETIEGSYYTAGQTVDIDGVVKGDLFCAGQNVNVNGRIEGDVICAGQSVNINGEVLGDIRIAGQTININSRIGKNANLIGTTINLASSSDILGELFVAGAFGNIKGKIGKDVYGSFATANVGAIIGGNVALRVGDNRPAKEGEEKTVLTIDNEAKIAGGLYYTSKTDANISNQALIGGETVRKEPKIILSNNKDKGEFTIWAWSRIFSIFASFLIGLVLISLWKNKIIIMAEDMIKRAGASIGVGAIALFLTPLVCLFLMFTLIGIPLSLIALMIWIVLMVVGKVMTGIMIGRKIVFKFQKEKKEALTLSMVAGVSVCWLIFGIPVFGWMLGFVAMLWGMGAIVLFLKQTIKN